LLDGIDRLMQKPDEFTGPVNLGNPHECSIRELAEMVLEITGSKSKIEFLPLPPDDPRQRKPDITIARAELGWEPKVPLKDGLRETVSYFKYLLSA
jgi:UDP-glucuronate decarboxylase